MGTISTPSIYSVGKANFIQIYKPVAGSGMGGSMYSSEAYSIDEKVDDGIASSGRVITARSLISAGCVDQPQSYSGGGVVNYLLNDKTNFCRMYFRFE